MEKIILTGDYHTHTVYSHGKGTVAQNAERAKVLGLREIAITDHGFSHFIFGATKKGFAKQKAEVDAITSNELRVLCGIEANLQGMSGKIDVPAEILEKMDILLCGFHKPVWAEKFSDYFKLFANAYTKYFFKPTKKQIERNTTAYINAVRRYPIDVITHLNYHIKVDCKRVAEECAKYGTFIELSSRHCDLDEKDIKDMLATDVLFIINSDAHKISNIGEVGFAKNLIEEYNIPQERVVNISGKTPLFRMEKARKQ